MALARLATITDKDWVRRSFLLSRDSIDQTNRVWQVYCSADSKFTDSSLGGNFVLNPPPQYTPYADIRHKGLVKETYTNSQYEFGMGHFYSEQIDDNNIAVTIRAGVAEYNGMWTFFTGFYDNDAAQLANTGIVNKLFYTLGKIIGVVFTIHFWPLMVLTAFGNTYRFVTGSPSSKYYYLQPTPYLFWSRTNFIATTLAVNMGIVPRLEGPFESFDSNKKQNPDVKDLVAGLNKMDSLIFRADGTIDVFSVATKAQRVANRRYLSAKDKINQGSTQDDVYTQLRAWAMDMELVKELDPASAADPSDYHANFVRDPDGESIDKYLKRYYGVEARDGKYVDAGGGWQSTAVRGDNVETREQLLKSDAGNVGNDGAATDSAVGGTSQVAPGAVSGSQTNDTGEEKPSSTDADKAYASIRRNLRTVWNDKYLREFEQEGKLGQYDPEKAIVRPSWWDEAKDQFEAEVYDASQFISFKVDNPGSINESFSNSTGESDIAGKLNGAVSSNRNARFTFSDGNTGIDVIDSIKSAVTQLASGVMEGIHISGLLSLAGAAFVDIPKVWQSSSASFPSASYTIKLRSPYGNKMSRFINLYVPLSALLALALPISTGKQSYTSPFLVEAYSRGRNAIRLGMVESLSITRGVGNLGWNNDDEPLGIDVSFTIVDLSTVMHAPIEDRIASLIPWKGLMDDDSAFGDYMSVLSSMSMEDMIYPYNKFMLNLTKKSTFMGAWTKGSRMGSLMGTKFPGRVMALLMPNPEISINR